MKEQTKSSQKVQESDEAPDKGLWRDLVAYWFLGLGNNYGFIVMLAGLFISITQG